MSDDTKKLNEIKDIGKRMEDSQYQSLRIFLKELGHK